MIDLNKLIRLIFAIVLSLWAFMCMMSCKTIEKPTDIHHAEASSVVSVDSSFHLAVNTETSARIIDTEIEIEWEYVAWSDPDSLGNQHPVITTKGKAKKKQNETQKDSAETCTSSTSACRTEIGTSVEEHAIKEKKTSLAPRLNLFCWLFILLIVVVLGHIMWKRLINFLK